MLQYQSQEVQEVHTLLVMKKVGWFLFHLCNQLSMQICIH